MCEEWEWGLLQDTIDTMFKGPAYLVFPGLTILAYATHCPGFNGHSLTDSCAVNFPTDYHGMRSNFIDHEELASRDHSRGLMTKYLTS